MPKTKLTIDEKYLDRLQGAAEICDVKLTDGKRFGTNIRVMATFRIPDDLFTLGREVEKLPVDFKFVEETPAPKPEPKAQMATETAGPVASSPAKARK